MPDIMTVFGLVAVVLLLAALTSGLVARAPLSFPMIFLGIGFLLSERGLGLLSLDAEDTTLEAVAIVSLALVLFIDAVKLQIEELRDDWRVPLLTTGPGTLLTIALIALAALLVLDEGLVGSLLLGATLASLDPVVLRDVVRDPRVPRSIRRTLSIEAGTNDIVVLPAILILIAVANAEAAGVAGWSAFLVQLFLLGPLAGVIVGGVGSWLVGWVDRRYPIPREYQALYGIGLVFAAFVAGEAVGGSGFLAAFMAGITVVLASTTLCDCFIEYGEVTAEMAMLLAFILFGAALATLIGTVTLGPVLLFTVLVLMVARPLAIGAVLHRARVSRAALAFVAWFGPRGLNSLLLALLAVHAHVPGAERLLAIVGCVVIVSVAVHGASATPLGAWYGRRVARASLDEERESTAGGFLLGQADETPRIAPAELAVLLGGPEPPIVLDVRTRSQSASDSTRIPGSVRVLPDQVAEWAEGQDRARRVVTYCT